MNTTRRTALAVALCLAALPATMAPAHAEPASFEDGTPPSATSWWGRTIDAQQLAYAMQGHADSSGKELNGRPYLAATDWNAAKADNSGKGSPSDHSTWPQKFDASGTGQAGWFGQPWSYDFDNNGCDAYNDVLKRDLSDVELDADGCTVLKGTLHDPYTDTTVTFDASAPLEQRAVQVDHVVSPRWAYAHRGVNLDADTRLSLANDPLNLVATTLAATKAKDGKGLATSPTGSTAQGNYQPDGGDGWMPSNQPAVPSYVARFALVTQKYGLTMGRPAWTAVQQQASQWGGSVDTSTHDYEQQKASAVLLTPTTTQKPSASSEPAPDSTDAQHEPGDDRSSMVPMMVGGLLLVLGGVCGGLALSRRRSAHTAKQDRPVNQ